MGFVFWIVVARFYPPEVVGLGAALISAAGLLTFVSSLGLGFLFVTSALLAGWTLALTTLILASYMIGLLSYVFYRIPKTPLKERVTSVRVIAGNTVRTSAN